ncbi:nucleoside recognition domain-containing protein [Oceanobacillus sp. J11TS1]|uniref:nucleoside recognition domain-containing protein n=1 Tax=Oceanobacillus sp. J11TS1 TaxID=2807191 RepID=UPI001B2056A3|nr:nucleoside recognition domain-containing protein [Oceanobacillus sp. J11TS1]GIO23907.1 putative membrane protein YvoD [Oceanobacillus sp. J11TS1]
MKGMFLRGLIQGLKTTLTLGKVIFPITLIITILQFTPIFPWFMNIISPLMGLFGLSGEAAVPLVLGNGLNLYAGIAAIISFDFTVKEVFILAVMLSFSHNLFIESAVATRVGVKWWVIVGIRVGLAVTSALLINLFWNGGGELAQYGFISSNEVVLNNWWEIVLHGAQAAVIAIVQLACIVIPLMIIMQVMRELGWLTAMSNKMAPFMKILGIDKRASMTMVAGLTIGLAYGAGLMMQAVKEDNVPKKDMYLALIFLVSCHAVVEDTLVFIPLGIPVWPLLIIRLSVAIILTMSIAYSWKKEERKMQHEHSYHSV